MSPSESPTPEPKSIAPEFAASDPGESPSPPPPPRGIRVVLRVMTTALVVGALAALVWFVGRRAWNEYRDYQEASRAAEDAAPVGYIGVNYRRSYHYKPARFLLEEQGRTKLWASKKEDGQPEFWDVTDADIVVARLSGGFGRDSVPGIDYPIFEAADSERGQRLRPRQVVYGLNLAEGSRGYPADLLKKIEVVNDRDRQGQFAIVFDRSRNEAHFYARTHDGREVTFGTTGYAYGPTQSPENGQPLLYDRTTRSLWLPEGKELVCVSGQAKGTKLPEVRNAERVTWSEWVAQHPKTRILMGNDRDKAIPAR